MKGDSMFPEYLDGDTVIIRKQPCCDSGDDCAVIINATDATLKRVHLLEDGIELEAINPMYGPPSEPYSLRTLEGFYFSVFNNNLINRWQTGGREKLINIFLTFINLGIDFNII